MGLLAALAVLALAATGARAAAPLTWTAAQSIPGAGALSAISCPSEALCVAVDESGNVLESTDPTAATPTWTLVHADPGEKLAAVACAGASLCVAVDRGGGVLHSSEPAAAAWSARTPIDGSALTGISCPSAALCVAVDAAGDERWSAEPAGPPSSWHSTSIDSGVALSAVSCANASACVAVDDEGDALSSGAPTAGTPWRTLGVDPASAPIRSLACPASGYCVAGDGLGGVLASADPYAASPTWSYTGLTLGGALDAVSCAATGLCATAASGGQAFASDAPQSALPAWGESTAGAALTGLACLPDGLCLGVTGSGQSISARVPAPEANTATPSEVTSSTATLSGVVNPNDAVLALCAFEYGTGIGYGSTVPCASVPAPGSQGQLVSAAIGGLLPNTTYHLRVLAGDLMGTARGADRTFLTASSPLIPRVAPHPSISGTPAVGQRLSCHPGTPAGALVTLTYAWLRDLIAIPEANGSTYSVKGTDSGHHLQCQVTATDGGGSLTAHSAFVTVPAGNGLASAGETQVGTARYSAGRIAVPVTCSTLAAAGCHVSIRLSLVEAISGRRVIAVSARAATLPRRARGAAVRRVLVTLAFARVTLASGQHRTVSVALTRAARRLLASRRRLPAEVIVTGTVIGVIEATLAQQRLQLRSASGRGARHRG